jgi:adenine deaminase
MSQAHRTRDRLKGLLLAAQGKLPCDLILRGASYLDVFSASWRRGDVAIWGDRIAGVDAGLPAGREIDARRLAVVPGFTDAHVHIESSLLVPENFQRAVLPKGTTTAICDPHELANVMGTSGIRYFLDAADRLALNLRVMLSSCVPATDFETNGGGHIRASDLIPLRGHPRALGLAEMMNVPGLVGGNDEVLEKIEAFSDRIIDGHCPKVSGLTLAAVAAAGISSCHESTELEEAREKLGKGLAIWIREGSVAKDLAALAPLLTVATSTSIGFCTDDRNPLDIATQGHIDYLVRGAIAAGVPPEIAYRSASWTPARHYRLDWQGAIAPGYVADLVLLDDIGACAIRDVIKSGKLVSETELPAAPAQTFPNTVRARVPAAADLVGPSGRVHVIGVKAGRILTDAHVMDHDAPGVARLSVLERYGHGLPPANGYVLGFGENFRGAIGSSVGHDSHNLIAVGSHPSEMSVAFAALARSGGGYCVVRDGAVVAELPLPYGGLMTAEEPRAIASHLTKLRGACRSQGCELPEPFLQLAFLSLPVIPSLKLTDRGLVDVDRFQMIGVSA